MNTKKLQALLGLLVLASMILTACATSVQAAPAPEDQAPKTAYIAGMVVVCNQGHLTGETSAHGNADKTEVTLTAAQADLLNAAPEGKKAAEASVCPAPAPKDNDQQNGDNTNGNSTCTGDACPGNSGDAHSNNPNGDGVNGNQNGDNTPNVDVPACNKDSNKHEPKKCPQVPPPVQ